LGFSRLVFPALCQYGNIGARPGQLSGQLSSDVAHTKVLPAGVGLRPVGMDSRTQSLGFETPLLFITLTNDVGKDRDKRRGIGESACGRQ
jgi:hypothetical protein